jgi:hypothetical protein
MDNNYTLDKIIKYGGPEFEYYYLKSKICNDHNYMSKCFSILLELIKKESDVIAKGYILAFAYHNMDFLNNYPKFKNSVILKISEFIDDTKNKTDNPAYETVYKLCLELQEKIK